MSKVFQKSMVVGISVMGLLFSAGAAHATPLLVSNFNFTSIGTPTKNFFQTVNPTNWVGNGNGALNFVDSPGAPGCATCADSTTVGVSTYGPFPNPPVAGNYVEADGDPGFGGVFYQTISGLTAGQTYSLSFYQAGAQAVGHDDCAGGVQSPGNPCITTTEQWLVSLGTSVLAIQPGAGGASPFGGNFSTFSNADPLASTQLSPVMVTPPTAVSPWNLVTLNLTASASTDILSFMAWGDGGSTGTTFNLPPMVFLTGATAAAPVPEPATITLFGIGLAGWGAKQWRKRRGETL